MSALPASASFTMVCPDHVAEVGPAAAILYARIAWRSERSGWRASRAILAEETGLTLPMLRTACAVLRDQGWITSERTSAGDSTQVWTAVLPASLGGAESSPPPCGSSNTPPAESAISLSTETEETTTYTADAVTEEPMSSADQPLEGVLFAVPDPEPTTPPQTAQTLVARWVDGYRTSNAGQDPPGPLMKRVAGQAKNLAKSCENDTDWGAAWRASYSAGQSGHADAVPFMAAARSRYPQPRNHDLERMEARANGDEILTGPAAMAVKMLGGGQ